MAGLSVFSRIDSLISAPPVTPQAFCDSQPCVNIRLGGADFILNQPTSSAIVYILGIMWLAAGLYFLRTRAGQRSRTWWSIALLLGGAAAISAGTSYQAFGYEIKCAGRELCLWTSWWEVAYLTLQAASMDAMLIALAYACASGKLRKALIAYAIANAAAHFTITAFGALIPVRFMISFELMILFTAPNLLILFILCGSRFRRLKDAMDRSMLGAGIWLIITTGVYFVYMTMGLTQKLWERGIWFSENDALHIFMIVWIVYIAFALGKRLKDTDEIARATVASK
jgi:hypothetical protein